jgi:hydrogenase nickel incorporation protein HypB
VLTKIDILPFVSFDTVQFSREAKKANPHAPLFQLSAWTGEGMETWTRWLLAKIGKSGESGCV